MTLRFLPVALLVLVALAVPGCLTRNDLPPDAEGNFPGTGTPGGSRDGGTADGGGTTDAGLGAVDVRFKLLAPGAGSYAGEVRQVSSGVDQAAYAMASTGEAITALAHNNAGFTVFGMKQGGTTRTFQTDTRQSTASALADTARSLGLAGYAPTAMTYDTTNGYTVVGLRELGVNQVFNTDVEQVAAGSLSLTAQSVGNSGYAPTGLAFDGIDYTLLSVKDAAVSRTYAVSVQQVDGTTVSATAQSLASTGYVVTAIAANNAGYAVVGVKQNGSTRTFTTSVQTVSAANLTSTVVALGNAGYVVTAASADAASGGYLLIGTK